MTVQTPETPIINLLKVDKLSPSVVNTNIKWKVEATGNELEYAWYIFKDEKRIQYIHYEKSNTFDWKPNEPGLYYVKVFVKDSMGYKVTEKSSVYKIVDSLKYKDLKSITNDKKSPQDIGTKITWRAEVQGDELEYAWYIFKDEERIEYIEYTNMDFCNWTPERSGIYKVKLFVKDKARNKFSKWSSEFIIN